MTQYSKKDPFLAELKERYNLCSLESKKETYHLSLDIKPSSLIYSVGDCIGVCPENDPWIVETLLLALNIPGTEMIVEKRTLEKLSFSEFLLKRANLAKVNKKLFMMLAESALSEGAKNRFFEQMGKEPEEFREYLDALDVLEAVLHAGQVSIDPQEFADSLMPLLPRFYSIASSMKIHPEEVHLTVAKVSYEGFGRSMNGVCTHFLAERAPIQKPFIPIFLQPHSGFTVPEDGLAPIIMIGPGTGVAPFRAFMQEREASSATGKNWLFYGDWFKSGTFLYQDYWQSLEKRDLLKIDLAFSRDQETKVYVQHRMLEQGKEFYSWLEEGAYLYVCGDAKRMAKDVELALLAIIQRHGAKTEEGAKEYVRNLRKQGRYLRDVY